MRIRLSADKIPQHLRRAFGIDGSCIGVQTAATESSFGMAELQAAWKRLNLKFAELNNPVMVKRLGLFGLSIAESMRYMLLEPLLPRHYS